MGTAEAVPPYPISVLRQIFCAQSRWSAHAPYFPENCEGRIFGFTKRLRGDKRMG